MPPPPAAPDQGREPRRACDCVGRWDTSSRDGEEGERRAARARGERASRVCFGVARARLSRAARGAGLSEWCARAPGRQGHGHAGAWPPLCAAPRGSSPSPGLTCAQEPFVRGTIMRGSYDPFILSIYFWLEFVACSRVSSPGLRFGRERKNNRGGCCENPTLPPPSSGRTPRVASKRAHTHADEREP